jgi:hypothetical protein
MKIFRKWIICHIYENASEPYYIIVLQTIDYMLDICNTLICFQFINLVFIVKQRYGHLSKPLSNWFNGTGSRPIDFNKQSKRCFQSRRTVDRLKITPLYVYNVGNVKGKLKQTDIHSLRNIYSELYDISCL